ncbi:hypothetical protein J0H58_20365 [bacterium]|nr:hypothetical protein [bacterium]
MIKAKFTWTVDPVTTVNRVSAGLRNRALRIALNAGASPVKQAVIATAPRDEGLLAKATIIVVRSYEKGLRWTAVVGAGSKFKRAKKTKNRSGKKTIVKKLNTKTGRVETQYDRPAKYQHLVDAGTKRARPRHYLPAALRQSKNQFEQRAAAKLKQVIEEMLKN